MNYDSSSSEEEEAPPNFECALAELLAAGLGADVRPLLQECLEEFSDAPESWSQAYKKLPPTEQEQLHRFLPAGDATRTDGLRNPALTEALREFTASLKETPTPEVLQRRRNKAWTPAVGRRRVEPRICLSR